MKNVGTLFFTVFILIFFGVGCVNSNLNETKINSETSQYTDPASPITVSNGEKFAIVLTSNQTTGYSWQLAKPVNEKILRLVNSEYIPAGSGLIGAGGKEIWTFLAVAAGETSISLKYARPWEKEKPPDAEIIYTVIVR